MPGYAGPSHDSRIAGILVHSRLFGVLGIGEGQTTPDMQFYFETVACVGTCFLAPVMMIDDQYFGMLTPQRIERILKSYQVSES